jgi:hypothetical protein
MLSQNHLMPSFSAVDGAAFSSDVERKQIGRQGLMHSTMQTTTSKKMLWTGRIVSALVVVLMLFDASLKVLRVRAVVEGTVQVGYPVNTVLPIGIVLLVCVVLYAIPRTSILGAILLTG